MIASWTSAVIDLALAVPLRASTGSVEDTSVLSPRSPLAAAISNLMLPTFYLLGAIFLLVLFLVGWALIRYRGRPGDPEPRQDFGSPRLEIAWTIGPTLIVVVLAIVSLSAMRGSDPPIPDGRQPDLVIVGHQWWWEVHYPASGVITANEIHIPVGLPLLVQLESADVIHDFWMPRLARKMDAVPGHPNRMWLQADTPGSYLGACAEFCGNEHAWMLLRAIAESQSDFDSWQAAQLQVPPTPTQGEAAAGARLFASRTCINCHAISGTAGDRAFAPNLTHLTTRQTIGAGVVENTPANLAAWLHDPDSFKPSSNMPNLQLSKSEVAALVAYLESLK